MSREINDSNYLEELFINEATPALENAGGNSAELEEGKALIAEAITNKGVVTAADASFDVMADNIGAIPVGKFVYLGTGTSFDVKSVCEEHGIDYTTLTNDNFITGISKGSAVTGSTNWPYEVGHTYCPNATGFTRSHTYAATTGVLTVKGNSQTVRIIQPSYSNYTRVKVTQSMTCFAYLVYTG